MASNKKINVPISHLSSNEIYALFDAIDSEDEEDIENLMNDPDTAFIDQTVIESKDLESGVSNIETRVEAENNIIPTTTPIEAIV